MSRLFHQLFGNAKFHSSDRKSNDTCWLQRIQNRILLQNLKVICIDIKFCQIGPIVPPNININDHHLSPRTAYLLYSMRKIFQIPEKVSFQA